MSIGPFNEEEFEEAMKQDRYDAHRKMRFALDTALAELRMSRFEILKEFVQQVAQTGRIKIAGDGNNPDYVYDFSASPWIEEEYVPKGLYEQKIAGIKKILSDCESLPEPPARS